MSTLLSSLGRWSFRHPWRVLVSWLLALGIAGAGALVLGAGTDNSFSIPGTESQAGLEQLSRSFPQVSGTNAQFIVVAAPGDEVTDDDYREQIESAVDELADLDGVLAATSPYDEMVDGMINDDETAAIVRLQFDGQSTDVSDETKDQLNAVVDDLAGELPEGAQAALGGDLFATSIPGVTITEAVGLLIALLVLIVTFRSFVVAGLPLLTAILGVGISMAGIFTATAFATVSSTTPLLALMLGLAVGIDYALFIMARHQDQVREGVDPEESAARAVGTAGSAVVFAGITVLIALIGLGFAGIPFLTTMGIAASVAVAIAVAIAVTLTPALLGFMKGRVAGRPPRARAPKKGATSVRPRVKGSARWVNGVTRHPVLVSLAVVLGLGIVAVPALSLNLALPNAGVLPEDSEARQSYDLVGEEFGPGFNGPLILTGTIVTSTDPLGVMEDLGDAVAEIDGVEEVALAVPNETADTGIVQIIPETAPDDPATADLVRELRSHHDEWLDEFGIDLKVTGFTAVAIDISDQLGNALLPFGIFVIGLSLILLTIVFRSIWVPVTAALGYLLSIVAAFGIVGAVFEWGWFADLLHVAKVGPIISFMPIVLMGVLFGLAMDYQVFLVSRMREDFVHDPDSKSPDRATRRAAALRAIRSGFTGSAKVVTAAGLIMFAVFVAFVPEGDSSLKPIALGLAAGIAIDAFLVRMTLIPALMAILGERAWEIPTWLEKILPRVDIEGEAVERERHLADWPGDGSVVAADELVISADAPVVEGLSVRLASGAAVIATGGDSHTRRALALTIAGRIAPTDGRLRVAGHLLPGRAAWVRSHVGCVLVDDADAALGDLAEALRGTSEVVVIDGLDRLSGSQRDQATAMLRDAVSSRPLAVFATASDAASARTTLAEAGWPTADTLDSRAPRRPAAESTEVTA
ncbi:MULTISPECIES: efflux RND transporter permease subunit [unclassified Microbacterium]|uniref:efflux RND transporter permease subunit n=1 Tax=unclassified Microbacterium TaxID=2609290 RepID=UPI000EAA2B99|nr:MULTISPECIES: MMPL family transporter [unclassified Microbacterium]MBT2484920.1 MMPL family transporter [Microbacterium sp. ISL-108]RKN67780.1 MMPL family transporter [Microbacterium sp. CGR2]